MLTVCVRPCKNRKIKCGEERPKCQNCEKQGEACDYSIRLNWEGRTKRKGSNENQPTLSTLSPPLKLGRSTSSTSGHSDSTAREITPNPTASLMNGFSTGPSSPGFHQFQMQTTPPTSARSAPPAQMQTQAMYNRDQISTAQLSRIRDQSNGQYPSPANSNIESPPLPNPGTTILPAYGHQYSNSNPEMPPPFQNTNTFYPNNQLNGGAQSAVNGDNRAKRVRLSSDMSQYNTPMLVNNYAQSNGLPNNTNLNPLISPPLLAPYHSTSPSNGAMRIPPTPAASIGSEDNHQAIPGPSPQPTFQDSPDYRRLSVKSLLSDDSPADSSTSSESAFPGRLNISSQSGVQKSRYGVDRGFPDLDLGKNDDAIALNGSTPNLDYVDLANQSNELTNNLFSGFAFGLSTVEGFQEGQGYYAKPVTVSISRNLEPLPDMLRNNPMNLLYFHHFLNHTARILVPHDCSENPFKSILPQSKAFSTNISTSLIVSSGCPRSQSSQSTAHVFCKSQITFTVP